MIVVMLGILSEVTFIQCLKVEITRWESIFSHLNLYSASFEEKGKILSLESNLIVHYPCGLNVLMYCQEIKNFNLLNSPTLFGNVFFERLQPPFLIS